MNVASVAEQLSRCSSHRPDCAWPPRRQHRRQIAGINQRPEPFCDGRRVCATGRSTHSINSGSGQGPDGRLIRLDSAPAGRRKWRHRHRPSCRGHYRNRTPPASTHRWASSGSGSGATGVEIADGFAPPSGRSVDPPVELIDHAESGGGRRPATAADFRQPHTGWRSGPHQIGGAGSWRCRGGASAAMVEEGRISRLRDQ
jgi:hypothetical protein